MPIRRRHRSGSDRLRRRPRPPNPNHRARRPAPAGSPRPRSDPNALADRYRDRHADTAYKHAVPNTNGHSSPAHEHTGAYCYDVTHTDRYSSSADKHAVSNTYRHACAAHQHPYPHYEGDGSRTPGRDTPVVRGAFH